MTFFLLSVVRVAWRAAAALLLFGACIPAHAALLDAIEYYNAGLDHYFVTAQSDEIAKLDSGFFVGWARTGLSFKVLDPTTSASGFSPVCRFYGRPSAGLDSHFYSASPAECAAVTQRFGNAWLLESSDVFQVLLPDTTTGACPSGSVPIYRSWNNRTDSNHRYTTDASVQQSMIAKGYIAEGYGPPSMPVAMCSPETAPGPVPVCQVTASSASATVGMSVTLSATCTGNPTSFTWTNCFSVTSNCTASSGTVGTQTYTLVASNAGGASAPATVSVNWTPVPQPDAPPICKLNATSLRETPTVGDLVVLSAQCNGTLTGISWTGCVSSTDQCRVRGSTPGPVTYTVTGSNSGGTGTASILVNWSASPVPLPGLCSQFPSALFSNIQSQFTNVYSVFFTDPPGFAWNGVWAVRFTVPAAAQTGQQGSLSAAEFAGPPTVRQVTLSRTACDFRAVDPSGNNGPIAIDQGVSANIFFGIGTSSPGSPGLQPGAIYYINVRNFDSASGTMTCPASQQRCDALVVSRLPGGN
ncbi:MAG TPA: hypothetical protein VMV45_11195 [Casimicrobiaceae bacterium]|nr:hypothetical protein [Casimicrobiaceae bacterium]